MSEAQMNRLPPSLLYLVIYNPTLQPQNLDSNDTDDEDAEEHAHVLFYTANNHAVSKDKVLRQVGLAKALSNFTTIFDSQSMCEAVHSQSRRMTMISPEPDYWIHACVELEKTPRKLKDIKNAKGKARLQEPVYDYNESSLHITALQTRLRHAYESFKIMHGSFTAILSTLGREALELQLERFFTVWAWSWDLGSTLPFSDLLGTPVHPLSNQLMAFVENLGKKLPFKCTPLILVAPCVIALKSSTPRYPPALLRHLFSFIPSRQEGLRDPAKMTTGDVNHLQLPSTSQPPDNGIHKTRTGTMKKRFLGVPTLPMNMNVDMDVRKWSWPGYLTFGIGGNASGSKSHSEGIASDATEVEAKKMTNMRKAENDDQESIVEDYRVAGPNISQISVDSQALKDALSSDANPQAAELSPNPADGSETHVPSQDNTGSSPLTSSPKSELESHGSQGDRSKQAPMLNNAKFVEDLRSYSTGCTESSSALRFIAHPGHNAPPPEENSNPLHSPVKTPILFSETHVYLPDTDSLDTRRRLIRYVRHDNTLLALLPSSDSDDDILDVDLNEDLADRCMELLELLKDTIEVEQEKIAVAFSSSPVQDVLQKSQHIVATPNGQTYTNAPFNATSWHFYEGKRMLELDNDLQEMYSRGQNPQDWHLVKHSLGIDLDGKPFHGDIYMDIARKEASLIDVDNEVVGVIRRFLE